MRIGIVGSRNITKVSLEKLKSYIPDNCCLIVSGGAIGIDKLAETIAEQNCIKFRQFLPNYEIFGKLAPLVRNTAIVENSDQVLAFWDFKSRGTAHTIKECVRLNVPVKIIDIRDIMK